MAFDTTRLVAQINLLGSIPEGRFTDQELLDIAYNSLISEIVPLVILTREDFFLTPTDFAITANDAAVLIPSRALNGVVREVKRIVGDEVQDFRRMDLEDVRTKATGQPRAFYLQGNELILYPTPSETLGTLRVWFSIRPSKLVPVNECGRITAISSNTVSLTIPSTWTTSETFDLVRGRAHFDILGFDLSATSVGGGQITFTADVPAALRVGDYVSLAEECCFPLLPAEGHVALVQSAVTTALESIGDPASQKSAGKTRVLLDSFRAVLSTRVVGAPKALGRRLL